MRFAFGPRTNKETVIAAVVYILCALTSLMCAVLLLRAYGKCGVRLLFWSGLCFVGLTLNNVLLFVDRQLFPAADLFMVRSVPALAGVIALLYGLVWDSE